MFFRKIQMFKIQHRKHAKNNNQQRTNRSKKDGTCNKNQ